MEDKGRNLDVNEIKEHIEKLDLDSSEKNSSFAKIEQWYQEDRAFGTLYEELAEISPKIEALFMELGLI